MGSGGFAVSQSEDSVRAIRKAFAAGDSFSAITFHTDVFAPSEDSVWVARSLSAAPFVLFENPSFYYCNKSDFDIVIPACARPSCWLKMLHDAVRSNSRSTPSTSTGGAACNSAPPRGENDRSSTDFMLGAARPSPLPHQSRLGLPRASYPNYGWHSLPFVRSWSLGCKRDFLQSLDRIFHLSFGCCIKAHVVMRRPVWGYFRVDGNSGRATKSESMSALAMLRQPLSAGVWAMVSLCSQSGLF